MVDEPVSDVLMGEVARVGDGAEPQERPVYEPLDAPRGGCPDCADAGEYDEAPEDSAVWPREQQLADEGGCQEEPVAAGVR